MTAAGEKLERTMRKIINDGAKDMSPAELRESERKFNRHLTRQGHADDAGEKLIDRLRKYDAEIDQYLFDEGLAQLSPDEQVKIRAVIATAVRAELERAESIADKCLASDYAKYHSTYAQAAREIKSEIRKLKE